LGDILISLRHLNAAPPNGGQLKRGQNEEKPGRNVAG
jgi:hypothetical protein